MNQTEAVAGDATSRFLFLPACHCRRVGADRDAREYPPHQQESSNHQAFSTVTPTLSIAFHKYPDGFQAATIGCTRPAESVARDSIV